MRTWLTIEWLTVGGLVVCAVLVAAVPAGTQAPGEVFRACDVCPEMVVLPEGDVALGRFEVTLEEYRAYAEAVPDVPDERCGRPGWRRSWRAAGYLQTGRHPVACVSWNAAQAYVRWLSRETGHQYRLPSDAEWGRGAAGSPKGCNQFFTKERGTCVVGSFPPSDAGIFDMVGNLSEWTNDYWANDPGQQRVLRGAHWASYDWVMRPEYRRLAGPHIRGNTIGFRVARTLP